MLDQDKIESARTSAAQSINDADTHSGLSRYRLMPLPIKIIFLIAPVAAIVLFVIHWFSIPIFGQVLAGIPYYYLLYAVLGFNVFMGLGATKRLNQRPPAWHDYLLAFSLWGIAIFFLLNADDIAYHNWDSPPNAAVFASAVILAVLGIEAGRRVGGWGYAIVMLISIVYPLFASNLWLAKHLGGVFYGVSFSFSDIMGSFAFGANGLLGMPSQTLGEIVFGFLLFAGLVMGMGGGAFFMKLATALLGRVRGGQAKVAVLASGLFGSITGSPIANIAGTGSFTIPAMKKSKFSPEYAAAIEACASTGSDTMPPVMGGMVFIMVVIFGIDYADVVIAAFLPSVLFYLGLLVQVDAYAARNNLKAVPASEIPNLREVFLEGWTYLVGLGLLVYGLVYMRWGAITPIYAVGAVIALRLAEWSLKRLCPGQRKENAPVSADLRRGWKGLESGLVQTSGLINYTVAIFLGMGLLMVGLLKTGMAAGLAGWIVSLGGSNIYLILFICFAFCLIMGMIGLQRTAYIFLAVIAVPAIIVLGKNSPEFAASGGLSVIGINLFLIFYAGLGGITPPVALNSFIAARIAGANPQRTSWIALRLGAVLIFLPFFFVLQPALLIIDSAWWQIILHFFQAAAGIWLLSSGLEGHLIGVGNLNLNRRIFLVIGGFLLAFPQPMISGMGLTFCLAVIAISLIKQRLKTTSASGLGP